MEDMSERNRLLETALTFHAKQLRKLVTDDEVTKFGDEYFNNDLSTEAKSVEDTRDKIKSNDYKVDTELGKMDLFEHKDSVKIMLDALKCYKSNLKKTIQDISKGLGECIPKFELVKHEIALCNYYEKNGFITTPPTLKDLEQYMEDVP